MDRVVEGEHGIDVSHHDGAIDWNSVAHSGVTFAMAKATEGCSFIDPRIAGSNGNWSGMKRAGVRRGVYHYYSLGLDPCAQAQHFIQVVSQDLGGLEPDDLPPALDLEDPSSSRRADLQQTAAIPPPKVLASHVLTWLEAVQSSIGRVPIIYTNADFWGRRMSGDFTRYPLWVASWCRSSPVLPDGWSTWTIWQYQPGSPGKTFDRDVASAPWEGLLPTMT